MSILFVLLMFLLVLTITYFRGRQEPVAARAPLAPPRPQTRQELGFEIPANYCFHPAHTWVVREGRESARIGVDSFATQLLDKVDAIFVSGEQRWVRQGQKLMTLSSGGQRLELVSPLEGVVTAVNPEVLGNPELLLREPYKGGWVCTIKSPEMDINLRNLVQGPMVAPWMQNSVSRLTHMLAPEDIARAQDGGMPLKGVLRTIPEEMRRKVVAEFFLT